jgi:hypothetical protein
VRLQKSYGYDHDQASKVYELMQVRQFETLFGTAAGAFAVYKFLPIQREISQAVPLFRKTWMRYPLLAAAFGFTYHCATMLPVKLFTKFCKNNKAGILPENPGQDVDLVGRFRVFDKVAEAQGNDHNPSATEEEILNYLSIHSKDPLSKPELKEHLIKQVLKDEDIFSKFQVKRSGKDKNDIYWNFGKIHGLENIGLLTEADMAECNGNPVKLQEKLHKIKPTDRPGYASHEELQHQHTLAMQEYKDHINTLSLQPSDRKRMLALPYYLSKRQDKPEPQIGQEELKMFEEIYGRSYFFGEKEVMDPVQKITEFDYENHIPQEILAMFDTNSDDFKEKIRMLNLSQKTPLEKHQKDKDEFRDIMVHLSVLPDEDKRSFIHMIKNE